MCSLGAIGASLVLSLPKPSLVFAHDRRRRAAYEVSCIERGRKGGMCVHVTEGFDRLWFFDRCLHTSASPSEAVVSAARRGRRWTRAQRTTSARKANRAPRETGEGEIEKPLGHHWVMALYKHSSNSVKPYRVSAYAFIPPFLPLSIQLTSYAARRR